MRTTVLRQRQLTNHFDYDHLQQRNYDFKIIADRRCVTHQMFVVQTDHSQESFASFDEAIRPPSSQSIVRRADRLQTDEFRDVR